MKDRIMARSTFSGPVASRNGFIFPPVTAAQLGAVANAVNTTDKVFGKSVVDMATGIIYTATGDTPTAPWVGSNSTTVIPLPI